MQNQVYNQEIQPRQGDIELTCKISPCCDSVETTPTFFNSLGHYLQSKNTRLKILFGA